MKFCPKCKVEKTPEEFHKKKANKSGLNDYCKPCQNEMNTLRHHNLSPEKKKERYEKARIYRAATRTARRTALKKWHKDNPDKSRRIRQRGWLKQAYGLTEAEYAALLTSQQNQCAICQRTFEETDPFPKRGARLAHVDHCHVTGKLRGILCRYCNIALGNFQDSEVTLIRAIEYLRKNKQ